MTGDGQAFRALFAWQCTLRSPPQREGELNVLGVLALGSDISLCINRQEVASFGDPDHPAGEIALLVLPHFEGGSWTLFDDAAIWVPAD